MIRPSLKMLGEKDLKSYPWLSYGGQPEPLLPQGLKFTKRPKLAEDCLQAQLVEGLLWK